MTTVDPGARRARRTGFLLALSLFALSGCGLAMNTEDRLNRAEQALADGEYRAAIIDAKSVLQDEPDNRAARLLLGRASIEVGDGASAEKELRRALELGADPQATMVDLGRALLFQGKFAEVLAEINAKEIADPQARAAATRVRGNALLGMGKPEDARLLFSEALAIDGDDLASQLGVVRSYAAERNFSQARETLNQVLSFDSAHIPAWLASGSLAMTMRDTERAVSDFARATDLANQAGSDALEMQALAGRADAHFVRNEVEEARPLLVRMTNIAPQDTRTHLVASRIAVADENWMLAQETLQEVLRREPEQRFAQMLLGAVHKERGNLSQAEMYLSSVVAAVPGNSNARRMLAEVRIELNKANEARDALQSVIAGPRADSASLSLAADASMLLGEMDEAEALLQRAVAADPDNTGLKLQLAVAYLRSGNFDGAQKLLEAEPETAGSDAEYQREYLLVITQMAQGDRAGARESAAVLLERWPDRVESYSLVGSMAMAMGDNAAARDSFNKALQVDPDSVASLRNLAQLDLADDDIELARDRYKVILELRPGDARAMVSLARLAAASENYDEATDWLEKSRAADRRAFVPRLVLGTVYLAGGQLDKAEEVAQEAIELQPNSAKAHSILGESRARQGNYRDAELSFSRAAAIEPDEPQHQLNVAKARAGQGYKGSAIEALQADMEKSLRHIPSAIALASLKADTGDLQGAAKISERLQSEHPEEATVLVLAAELAAKSGDLEKATETYDQVLAIENTPGYAMRAYQVRVRAEHADPLAPLLTQIDERPFDNNMRNYLAAAYMRTGDVDKANTQYETVLSQDPDNFLAANNLAYNYFEAGDARAEDLARRAYELRPDNAAVADTLGWILVSKGKVKEGIGLLRAASRSSRDDPEIQYHLAAALAADGDSDEAKSILQNILKSEDRFSSREQAEELLARL